MKDKDRTKAALKKAWKSFENILPQFLGIIFVVGLMLAILEPETVSQIIGKGSGIFGVTISAAIGSVAMMPAFVAFVLLRKDVKLSNIIIFL